MTVAVKLYLNSDTKEFYTDLTKDQIDFTNIPILNLYNEAVNHSIYGEKWCEAIHTEIQTLICFETWEYVKWSRDQLVLDSCWVFDIKRDSDDQI